MANLVQGREYETQTQPSSIILPGVPYCIDKLFKFLTLGFAKMKHICSLINHVIPVKKSLGFDLNDSICFPGYTCFLLDQDTYTIKSAS